jgi:hypothetical protein
MITNFNKRMGVATPKPGMWNAREQRHESPNVTLVERVCNFLEMYQLSAADNERIAPSASIETTVFRGSGHPRAARGRRISSK